MGSSACESKAYEEARVQCAGGPVRVLTPRGRVCGFGTCSERRTRTPHPGKQKRSLGRRLPAQRSGRRFPCFALRLRVPPRCHHRGAPRPGPAPPCLERWQLWVVVPLSPCLHTDERLSARPRTHAPGPREPLSGLSPRLPRRRCERCSPRGRRRRGPGSVKLGSGACLPSAVPRLHLHSDSREVRCSFPGLPLQKD